MIQWLKSFGKWFIWAAAGVGALALYLAGKGRGKVREKVKALKQEREALRGSLKDDLAGRDAATLEAEKALRAQQSAAEKRREARDELEQRMADNPSTAGSIARLKRSQERSRNRRNRR